MCVEGVCVYKYSAYRSVFISVMWIEGGREGEREVASCSHSGVLVIVQIF